MDTSDSEYFESADESFHSDDENTTSIIVNKVKKLEIENNSKAETKQDVESKRITCNKKFLETKEPKSDCKSEELVVTKKEVKEEQNQVIPVLANKVKSLEIENKSKADTKLDVQSESLICNKKILETKQPKKNDVKSEELVVTKKEVKEEQNQVTPVLENKIKSFEIEDNKNVKVKQDLDFESTDWDKKIKETKENKNVESNIMKQKEKAEKEEEKEEEENLWADDEGWGNLDVQVDSTIHDNTQLPSDLKKGKLVSKYVPDEDKWEFDSWEPLNDEKPKEQHNSTSSWSSWGNWGVSSIISTATQGVTTLTSQVSQGLSNVIETGIGVPDPEELARLNRLRQDELLEKLNDNEKIALNDNNNPLSFGLGNLVSGVSQITKIAGVSQITKIVESTGSKVINSGLDTLETIGKKTMEVLQEGDPGLKKKRAFLQMNQDKPVLSQILREAKEKAEEENRTLEQKHFARKANYESIFDDCQGLVHLEALEMLSRQCDIKLQTVLETYSGDDLKEVQETMEQVKELCEIPDEEEEETLSAEEIKNRLQNAVSEIGINITYDRLISTWEETENWLNKISLSICSERELHQQAIETLAQLTAIAVEQFHKGGELLLIKEHRSTADEADSLVQLTTTLTALIGVIAGKFSEKLNSLTVSAQNKEEINSLITNIFLEAANSSSYIQDAFQLLIPVLQVGAI